MNCQREFFIEPSPSSKWPLEIVFLDFMHYLPIYLTAVIIISIAASKGNLETSTTALAGGSPLK